MTSVERFRQWLRRLLGVKSPAAIQGLVSEIPQQTSQEIADIDLHAQEIHQQFFDNGIKQIKRGEIPGFWCDEYVSVDGPGYVLNYEKEQDGKKLRRSIEVGPKTSGDTGWVEVPELPVIPAPTR